MAVSTSVETDTDEGAEFQATTGAELLRLNFELTLAPSQLVVLETLIRKTVRDELDGRVTSSGLRRDDHLVHPQQAYAAISVADLAADIHQSEGTTRKLLSGGLIPGARRKDPTKRNSHWVIPACAPRLYLQQYGI
jgi:hypothetical protein